MLETLRKGISPDPEAIGWFAKALGRGDIDDAQAGAFAMGVCQTGLSVEARVALTLAMRDSGKVLHWDLPGPVADKHSTGGIGDPISLMLGPALASLGVYVPMISGRGLGHTGGTLDKLESIPGVSTELSEQAFRDAVQTSGCALAAASPDIAPADRLLYAVRDVTSTVESIDLITASILSKKLAGGVGPLVLDVKSGSGSFMQSLDDATKLAESLVTTANGAAGPAAALITDMNQPCIASVGNALEIMEVAQLLSEPNLDNRAMRLTAHLGGELLRLAGMAETRVEGAAQIEDAMTSGGAAERFGRMVAALGGPNDFVERWRDRLPAAPVVREITAPRSGTVQGMNGRALGMGVVHLGGGRMQSGDQIDVSVGLSDVAYIGDKVETGDPIAILHGTNADDTEAMAKELAGAFQIVDGPVSAPQLLLKAVT